MSLTLKFVFVGDSSTGKTAINHKFVTQSFCNAPSTIGAIFSCRQLRLPNPHLPEVKIHFWDTAGQERFRSIVPMYYRGSSAILLVFDLTNRQSFQSIVDYWSPQVANETYIKLFLIGNKTDLGSMSRQVSRDEAQTLAQTIGANYVEISAKCDHLESVLKDMIEAVCLGIDQAQLTPDKLQFYGVRIGHNNQTPTLSRWRVCC